MLPLDPESVDLAQLVDKLRERFAVTEGSSTGKTVLRDAVAEHLGCSLLEAEQLVDTLIARGFARLEHAPDGPEIWRLR